MLNPQTTMLKCSGAVAVWLAAIAFVPRARADFKVEYGVGANLTVVVDNGVGDLDPTAGSIFISKTVDQVTFSIVANSNRLTPEVTAQVQDASVNVQNLDGRAHVAQITITDTGFTFPGVAGNTAVLESRLGISSIGGPNTHIGGTFQSFADNNNAEFGKTISTTKQPLNFPLPPADQFRQTLFTRGDAYSMSNEFMLTLPPNQENGAAFTGTTRVFLTSAPANVVLLTTALPVLGLCGWVVRRRKETTVR
jgi:hypothetical protein